MAQHPNEDSLGDVAYLKAAFAQLREEWSAPRARGEVPEWLWRAVSGEEPIVTLEQMIRELEELEGQG